MNEKPPYEVPSMEKVRAVEPNGYRVVSTFSGCGGTCLGYRMAGFEIAWASEFIDAAAEVYRLNADPRTVLDDRDIRQVRPEEILEATGMNVGDVDVFEGSPPCSDFSMAGKREKSWGKVKQYSDSEQRTDDLFFEYVRLIRGLQPKVFTAENVAGLVRGTAKGYFKRIIAEMRDAGYVVGARVLDAQWLGVPQTRQRVFFVGVRNDFGIEPAFPDPLPYRYSVRDALPWIDSVGTRDGLRPSREPAPTVQTHGNRRTRSELTAVELVHEKGSTKGRRKRIDDVPAPTVMAHDIDNNRSGSVLLEGAGPPPVEPEADIARFAIGREYLSLEPGQSSDRYYNLIRPHPDKPSPTVTQTGGISGAASVVHPLERRKFSIGELKRICAFPDDFELTGTYHQQWERLGRSVPPLMARAVAEVVRDRILGAQDA